MSVPYVACDFEQGTSRLILNLRPQMALPFGLWGANETFSTYARQNDTFAQYNLTGK